MASSKSGKAKADLVRRFETGSVKGASGKASGSGISRQQRPLTTTQLRAQLDAQIEAEFKPKGSSSTPSSETAQRANIVKGGFR